MSVVVEWRDACTFGPELNISKKSEPRLLPTITEVDENRRTGAIKSGVTDAMSWQRRLQITVLTVSASLYHRLIRLIVVINVASALLLRWSTVLAQDLGLDGGDGVGGLHVEREAAGCSCASPLQRQ
jgi:hypothetical protein